MLTSSAEQQVRKMVVELRRAGLDPDLRKTLDHVFVFYFYNKDDPTDQGMISGRVISVQMANDEIHLITTVENVVAPDDNVYDLDYIWYDHEERKWWGRTDHEDWDPFGELVILPSE